MTYRLLDHTADLRIEVDGGGIRGLFINSAMALMDLLVGVDSDRVDYYCDVKASGDTYEELLVDWMREILFIFDTERKVISTFDIVEFSGNYLLARCGGYSFDPKKDEVRVEIKAVTYHGLEIKERGEKMFASIIFDV